MSFRARYRHRSLLWAVLLAATATSGSAAAQSDEELPEGFGIGDIRSERMGLRKRLGVERAADLLLAQKWRDRVRGIERLSHDGSDEAVAALVEAAADDSALLADPVARLELARALAPHAKRDQVSKVLYKLLIRGDPDVPHTPLEHLTRATAAMALARAGHTRAVTSLTASVIGRGDVGKLAREALLAHPPASLEPLVHNYKRSLSASVVELLGDLRDPRAIGVLRHVLAAKAELPKQAAALALAKLGDGHAATVARAWIEAVPDRAMAKPERGPSGQDSSDEEIAGNGAAGKQGNRRRLVAARVLLELDAPDATAVLAALLGDATTRSEALSIAERSLSPALVPTLAAVIEAPVAPAERMRAVALLTRIGGARAVAALVQHLAEPELATTVALGLARMDGPEANAALASGLEAAQPGSPKRLMVRAALVRWLRAGERVAGLDAALDALAASSDASDRAVAAFGDGITGRRTISALLAASEGHPELLAASARAALALGPRALAALAPRLRASLRSDPDGQTVSVEAAALLVGPAGLSANQLAAAAERGRWWAPLAALRLAANDSKQVRPRLERLLGGSDPLVRQHVALGLGLSPEKSAVSLLTEAYRTEPEPSVRRAIVRALSRRREVRRLRTLRLARDLDPDSSVRALARTALAGRRLDVLALAPGRDVAWIVLRPNDPSERAAAVRAALLTRAGLPALPAMADPDAVLLVPGARDTHEHALRLAPARASDQP